MTESNNVPSLSIVILCYRGEESIIGFVREVEAELRKEGLESYELVLVANYLKGKSDKTPEIVRRLASENGRILPVILEKQGGMGWDAISGLRAATGNAVALIDGDGQMPPKDIVRLWRVLKSGEFDFIKTLRTERLDGSRRILVSRVYNFIFHMIFPGSPYRDINSKPKLITREALNQMQLRCHGWFMDGELMLEVRRLNLSFAEIPTIFNKNDWRSSFVNWGTAGSMIGSMIAYRIHYWRRK